MKYRRVGQSGLKVSEMALGCGSTGFVGRADEQTALAIIRRALELGINFIDTSAAGAEGRGETLVGKAVKGKRTQVIIATKFGRGRSVGPSEQRGSRRWLLKSVESSLRRLETDYIDLYAMHEADPDTPMEETLRALDDLVRGGKVRYIGCSDFTAWQLCEALWISRARNLESFIAAYMNYNLISRDAERELVPCCQNYGVGVLPIRPQAGGFLTGKYQRGKKLPEGTRFTSVPAFADAGHKDVRRYDKLLSDANFDKLAKLQSFAEERGHRVGDLAICWLLSHSWVSTALVGVTNIEQLTQNVAALDWALTDDDVAELETLR